MSVLKGLVLGVRFGLAVAFAAIALVDGVLARVLDGSSGFSGT